MYDLRGAGQGRVVTSAGEQKDGAVPGHTHSRRQKAGPECKLLTWLGAFITSYHSEDLKEQAWVWQETVWLLNLTFICDPAFRSHGQGLHQKPEAKQGLCIMQCLCNGL